VRSRPAKTIQDHYNVGSQGSPHDVTTLGYNDSGELTSCTDPGAHTTAHGYDGARRLTSAGSAAYSYDAADNLPQTTDPTGQAVSQSFDAANELASQSVGGGTTNTSRYEADGNRTSATDQNGGTVSTCKYDAYGNPTGPRPAVAQPFGYAGQYTDQNTGSSTFGPGTTTRRVEAS
jgi:YD repeat-containing protein